MALSLRDILSFVFAITCWSVVLVNCNLLHNGDFENTDYSGNWYCQSCHAAPSTDAYHGSHSVHVSNRYDFKVFAYIIRCIMYNGGLTTLPVVCRLIVLHSSRWGFYHLRQLCGTTENQTNIYLPTIIDNGVDH